MNTTSERARFLTILLLLATPVLILLATAYSETSPATLVSAARLIASKLYVVSVPDDVDNELLKLRLFRALCAAGVGGSLALAGAMAQGLFRNPMAEPGLLGIGSGATLGAVLGIAVIGGYGPAWGRFIGGSAMENVAPPAYFTLGLVPVLSLFGALAVALTVYRLSTRGGRLSVSFLLLTGLAVNAISSSLMAMMQMFLLSDWQVSQAIMSWGFGTLDDRNSFHLAVIWSGATFALGLIPFVGLELDMLAGGEQDAAALGADPVRIKTLVLSCIAIATAASVAFCGQIAFVGLLVPHIVRMLIGPKHRTLLPLSFLAGATLLLSMVVFQHGFCPWLADAFRAGKHAGLGLACDKIGALQPGILTSLIGSPFFLYLLLRQGKRGEL